MPDRLEPDGNDRVGREAGPRRPSRFYVFGWMFYLLLAIAAASWIGVRDHGVHLRLFVDQRGWWIDAALALAVVLAMLAVWELAQHVLDSPRRLSMRLAEMLGPLELPEVIGLALLSGFAEELFFRGAVQGSFGLIAASVVFALLHTGPGPEFRVWTLFAAVAGFAFGGLAEWRGNLLAPILAHVVFNAIGLARLARLASQPSNAPHGRLH